MAFTFENYGTFTGSGTPFEYRDNDDFSLENYDRTTTFNLNDIGLAFVKTSQSPVDYASIILNNNSTSSVLLTGSNPTVDFIATGEVKSNNGSHILSNKKDLPFDMPHPNKKGWRLRHVCIEGPEIAVYCRGRVPKDGIINLPDFWEGLVNMEDISISLTPIGCWQELFVKEVLWGKQVIVQNNAGGPICADYYIVGRRLDDDLIVEYEGESHEDYPGGNDGYSFNFEHNYVKNLIQETVRSHLDKDPEI